MTVFRSRNKTTELLLFILYDHLCNTQSLKYHIKQTVILVWNTFGLNIIHKQIKTVGNYNPISLKGFREHSQYLKSFFQTEAEMEKNMKNKTYVQSWQCFLWSE